MSPFPFVVDENRRNLVYNLVSYLTLLFEIIRANTKILKGTNQFLNLSLQIIFVIVVGDVKN